MATDEEVEDRRARVIELRAQLEEARTGGEEQLNEVNNDIQVAQLDAEAARLETELAQLNESAKATVVRRGAEPVLGTVKDQMEAAVQHQKAVAKQLVSDTVAAAPAPPTPTDAAETNVTTDEQAANAPVNTAADKQAPVKVPANKTEGAVK